MNQELLEKLSVITEEESCILKGEKNIDTHLYTEKKELIVDCGKLLDSGKLIQIRPHTRFIHFPKHRHNYIELIYMCKGTTKHMIDGNELVLHQGDLLFLNQAAEQEILPAGKDDIAVNFIILPEFFETSFAMIGQEENLLQEFLIGCLCGRQSSANYLFFHLQDALTIQNLAENMIWSIMNHYPNKRKINQTTMGLLLMLLLNYMDKLEVGKNKFEQEIVVKVLSYVEEHYKNGSLTELANELNCDMQWLSRQIKKLTGKTYQEILLTKRINQAVYLLQYSNLPVAGIIESVGYDNTSYFYRLFRLRYQMSPKEYRLQYRSQVNEIHG